MNKTALKACFQSDNFRLRLHGAMLSAAKKGFSAYVKNAKGENFIRVEHIRHNHKRPQDQTGFRYTDKRGRVIPQETVYSFLSGAIK